MSISDSKSAGISNDDLHSVLASAKLVEDNTNGDDNNNSNNSNALGEGISTLLSGVIRDFDSKANDTSQSQIKLFSALDRLTAELDQLLEDAPLPFIMQHATKLSNVRRRVSSLNSLLRSVQHRLDNIDRIISTGSLDSKSNIGGPK